MAARVNALRLSTRETALALAVQATEHTGSPDVLRVARQFEAYLSEHPGIPAPEAGTQRAEATRLVPTPGRIVLYTLSEADAEAINRRRLDATVSDVARAQTGAQVHVGNEVRAGDVVPAVVVRVWPDGVNAQALLDGNDTLWLTSRREGTEPGTWAWPPRG